MSTIDSIILREPTKVGVKGVLLASKVLRNKVIHAITRHGDLVLACALMMLALPLWLGVALAIKCGGRGPVLAGYRRVGRDGREFVAWQFCTTLHRPRSVSSTMCWDEPITRVGRFLCDTGANSLPQLVNVLRGEMTLIGADRERPDFFDIVSGHWWPRSRHRSSVLPAGLTLDSKARLAPTRRVSGGQDRLHAIIANLGCCMRQNRAGATFRQSNFLHDCSTKVCNDSRRS